MGWVQSHLSDSGQLKGIGLGQFWTWPTWRNKPMRTLVVWASLILFPVLLRGQTNWEITQRQRHIQIDGFTKEWEGIPSLKLFREIGSEGFEEGDSQLSLRGLWDKENLYLALLWTDDVWDIERVRRRDAVWVTPDRRRRDRMLFFDFLKFHIRRSDYDYTFWLTPRVESKGPYRWHRLLEGLKGMETATAPPVITGRQNKNIATMEVLFSWREMRIKPKAGKVIPLRLILADSDLPETPLEMKLERLKSIRWRGSIVLTSSKE